MKAQILQRTNSLDSDPLVLKDVPEPVPGSGELLVRIKANGICHADLHIVEADISPGILPIIPGHQILGEVAQMGPGSGSWRVGERVGIPWLYDACGECGYCRRGEENLCPQARFTGFDVNGGYAEYVIARADYALKIPEKLPSEDVPPLLCAGIIGFRSLRLADISPGDCVGLVGFGASAHLAIQVALSWGCEVHVFTRSEDHRRHARSLGAAWAGQAGEDSGKLLDRAVIFAPSGDLVPIILEKIRPGGTLAVNAIFMSPIPSFSYDLLYGEKTLRSVSNATRKDGDEFLNLAAEIAIKPTVRQYPLEDANKALTDLKQSEIRGSGVLIP